jgi:hypothetical protein
MRSFEMLRVLFDEFRSGDERRVWQNGSDIAYCAKYKGAVGGEIVWQEQYPYMYLSLHPHGYSDENPKGDFRIRYYPACTLVIDPLTLWYIDHPEQHPYADLITRCRGLYRTCEDYDPKWLEEKRKRAKQGTDRG